MNILIPMAGQGSRFQQAGYSFPKPLIDVNHKPMIQVVTDNLNIDGRHIFLVLKDHYHRYSLQYLLPLIVQPRGCDIIQVDRVTQGAACTALLARDLIDNDDELVIANSDQWVDWDSRHFLSYMRSRKADGGILTFFSTHPKWSFVKVDELSSRITEVAEKKPISNLATVGIYYFRHGHDFVAAADRMIARDNRVNGEFYVAPTYNEMIADGKMLLSYPVAEMKGLGTPEDLERFLTDHKEKRRAS
jgi:dTDP-glucose pyrophosphorylase